MSRQTPAAKARVWVAGAAGAVVGLGAFAVLLMAGVLLYNRLWSGSTSILIAVCLTFGAIGAYGGWLLGLIVFSAARGAEGDQS